MKKIFPVLLLGLSLTPFAWGDPVEIGIRGGVNMANQTIPGYVQTPQISNDVLFGFVGAVFVKMKLIGFLSFQPEAEFSVKGYQENFKNIPVGGGSPPDLANGYLKDVFNYLEFPLLLRAETTLAPHLTGSLSAGPSLSILLNANENEATSLPYFPYESQPITNGAGLEGGVVFGAGLELDRILLDLRYDLGLTSVYQNGTNAVRNSVLSLQVGYRIF